MEKIKSKYANKIINSKYYLQLTVNDERNTPKKLTKEEFKAGKAGLVYFDNKSNKLVFDE